AEMAIARSWRGCSRHGDSLRVRRPRTRQTGRTSLSRPIKIPPFHHSTIPSFHHSIIPPFHHSTIPSLHHSIIPPFHHSTLPPFHHSITPPIHQSNNPPLPQSTNPPIHQSTNPSCSAPFPLRPHPSAATRNPSGQRSSPSPPAPLC